MVRSHPLVVAKKRIDRNHFQSCANGWNWRIIDSDCAIRDTLFICWMNSMRIGHGTATVIATTSVISLSLCILVPLMGCAHRIRDASTAQPSTNTANNHKHKLINAHTKRRANSRQPPLPSLLCVSKYTCYYCEGNRENVAETGVERARVEREREKMRSKAPQ